MEASQCAGLLALRLAFLVVLLIQPQEVLAVPALNLGPYNVLQPDGSVVSLQVKGDEWGSWEHDALGYTVVRNPTTKEWVYATSYDFITQTLRPSNLRVGRDNPQSQGLLPNLYPRTKGPLTSPGTCAPNTCGGEGFGGCNCDIECRLSRTCCNDFESTCSGEREFEEAPTPPSNLGGTMSMLVVPVRFSDHSERQTPFRSDLELVVRDMTTYVRQQSYGRLILQAQVLEWVSIDETEAQCAGGGSMDLTSKCMRNALQRVNNQNLQLFDINPQDGEIDLLVFIHSGYDAAWGGVDVASKIISERIWSHTFMFTPKFSTQNGVQASRYAVISAFSGTTGSSIPNFSTLAHEVFHLLGLPELYDTDYSGSGVGAWSIMSLPHGFNAGRTGAINPPPLSAVEKIKLGWIVPQDITSDGTFVCAPSDSSPTAFRIQTGFPLGEYLVIENRNVPGTGLIGLAIWHVDELRGGWTLTGDASALAYVESNRGEPGHYRVALMQADGLERLEQTPFGAPGDINQLFHERGATSFGPSTNPRSDSYQGIVQPSGVTIDGIREIAGRGMSFNVSLTAPVVCESFQSCGECTGSSCMWNSPASGISSGRGFCDKTCIPGFSCMVRSLQCPSGTVQQACSILTSCKSCTDAGCIFNMDRSGQGSCSSTCASLGECTFTSNQCGNDACIFAGDCAACTQAGCSWHWAGRSGVCQGKQTACPTGRTCSTAPLQCFDPDDRECESTSCSDCISVQGCVWDGRQCTNQCPLGLQCTSAFAGSCAVRCRSDNDCGRDSYCQTRSATCVAYKSFTENCDAVQDTRCGRGLKCTEGKCTIWIKGYCGEARTCDECARKGCMWSERGCNSYCVGSSFCYKSVTQCSTLPTTCDSHTDCQACKTNGCTWLTNGRDTFRGFCGKSCKFPYDCPRVCPAETSSSTIVSSPCRLHSNCQDCSRNDCIWNSNGKSEGCYDSCQATNRCTSTLVNLIVDI